MIVDHMVCSLVAVLHVRDPSKACTKEDWFPPRFNISGFKLCGRTAMHAVMRLMQGLISNSYNRMLGFDMK